MTKKTEKFNLKPALSSTVGTSLDVLKIRETATDLINAESVVINATQFYFEVFKDVIASHDTDAFIALRTEFLAVLGFEQLKELQTFERLTSLYQRLSEWYKYCQNFDGAPQTHNELRKEREVARKAEREAKKKIEEENAVKAMALGALAQALLIELQGMTIEEQNARLAPLNIKI